MTGVSERVRPQLYFDTLSLKNWLSYTARHIVYALLFAVEIPPNHVFIMRVYTIIVLYLVSVTALQKDEGYFPSATIF